MTRDAAGNRALAAGTEADPVVLEIMSNLFMNVADQMGATLANTSWSVNIKERYDFSCAIFDAAGDLVANAPHVPVHLGSMSDSIKTVMRLNPDLADGDAFMLNSPYRGGTHLPDVTVVTPVFVAGQPAFWLGSRSHHADIGWRTPGSAPPDSTRIDEEGVLIDNVKLVSRGQFLEDDARRVLALGRYPCRNPDQNIADLKAQVAANATGRRELLRVCAEQGAEMVTAYMGQVQSNAEESVRRVIDRLCDGRFSYPMDNGRQIEVAVSVDHVARAGKVDFTGTSAQHAGNYNAPFAVCRAVVLYVFRTLVGSDIPLNEGCLKPLNIIAPEGCMLNPRYPAAVIAGSQATRNNFVWGNDDFQNYETIAGGTGAGPGFESCDAVQSHMTNTRMTDPEVLEKRFPVRQEDFAIRPASGGAGQYRGGHGVLRRMRFLTDVTVTTLCSHRRIPPFGAQGGDPGRTGRNRAELPDGSRVDLEGDDEIGLRHGNPGRRRLGASAEAPLGDLGRGVARPQGDVRKARAIGRIGPALRLDRQPVITRVHVAVVKDLQARFGRGQGHLQAGFPCQPEDIAQLGPRAGQAEVVIQIGRTRRDRLAGAKVEVDARHGPDHPGGQGVTVHGQVMIGGDAQVMPGHAIAAVHVPVTVMRHVDQRLGIRLGRHRQAQRARRGDLVARPDVAVARHAALAVRQNDG